MSEVRDPIEDMSATCSEVPGAGLPELEMHPVRNQRGQSYTFPTGNFSPIFASFHSLISRIF